MTFVFFAAGTFGNLRVKSIWVLFLDWVRILFIGIGAALGSEEDGGRFRCEETWGCTGGE